MKHAAMAFSGIIGWTFHGREEVDAYHQRLFAKKRDPRLPSLEIAYVTMAGESKKAGQEEMES